MSLRIPEEIQGSVGSWVCLSVLLALLLAAAGGFDRSSWPGLVGDEATYLMQAQSLAWDLDLTFERQDFDRFEEQWGLKPEGLILQSPDDGKTYIYGKPFVYSLYLAPFLRIAPVRGAPVANALLLALAALAAGWTMRRRIGAAAPVFVAVFVFASVMFGHVFWVHADLFLACLVALALALAYGGSQHRTRLTEIYSDASTVRPLRFRGRWALVGALLGVVLLSRPLYGLLLPALALAVPRIRRREGLAALGLGVAGFLSIAVLTNFAVRDTWTSYAGERQGFYSYTGFPLVDLEEGSWTESAAKRGAGWVRAQTFMVGFDGPQTAWNLGYFLAGRHVGVLPYFLPLLLGLWAFRPGEGRTALLLAVGCTAALFLLLKPFNFFGGGDALANRYFLPMYPALWFVAARPRTMRGPVLATLAAVPFLLPLWLSPWGFPRGEDGSYRHVSAVAQRWLPYETSQSHLKPSGTEDVIHNGLWVKSLSPALIPEGSGSRFRWNGAEGQLLIGHNAPLEELDLLFDAPGPSHIELQGGRLGETALLADGRSLFQVRPVELRARHRMWWTNQPVHLYQIAISPSETEAEPPQRRFQIVGRGPGLSARGPQK